MSLTTKNLSLNIGTKQILKNINITLSPSEHVVILGANGAGKSTLLKALSGETVQYSGDIKINQQNLKALSSKTLARMRSVMPQEIHLNFPFRIREVVEMGSAPFPPSLEEAQIVTQCLETFEVQHLQEQLYPSLSGGEKQRVQLARVFCQLSSRKHALADRYLFLDECSSALDPSHQFHVFEQVRALCKQGIGVLSIVHDLNLAARFADRIILMNKGEVLAEGSPEAVLTPDKLESAYGIETQVIQHPVHDYPLIVSLGRVSK